MKFSTALIAAAAALPSFVAGHIMMVQPAPYEGPGDSGVRLDPLAPDGSNFPCHIKPEDRAGLASVAPASTISAGSEASIKLQGSAVHGGGSCQVSITYDLPPTPDSVFRVLKTFEGGCPISNGDQNRNNVAEQYNLGFTVPKEVAGGKAVLVWTWFNRVGNREMYMRCAPVNVDSDETDKDAINDDAKFPIMFRANIGAKSGGCATPANTNLIFPNPGPNQAGKPAPANGETLAAFLASFVGPTGNCGSTVPREDKPQTPGEPIPKEPIRKPTENDIGDDEDEPVISIINPAPTATPTSAPAAPTPTNDTKVPAVPKPPVKIPSKKPVVETPIKTPVKVEKPVDEVKPSPTPSPSPVTPSPVAGGNTDGEDCEINGQIYCNGEDKFFVCNWNKKVDMGSVSAGTKCVAGKIQKRNMVRFSSAHLRRRHHHNMKF